MHVPVLASNTVLYMQILDEQLTMPAISPTDNLEITIIHFC